MRPLVFAVLVVAMGATRSSAQVARRPVTDTVPRDTIRLSEPDSIMRALLDKPGYVATFGTLSAVIDDEVILSPSFRIASAVGPTKTTPSRSQRSTNSGCSATRPHPTHAASAAVSTKASSRRA